MGDRNVGLIEKYRVERTDGKAVGQCFVLEVEDPNTWGALLTWADTVQADGYQALADDVRALVEGAIESRGAPEPGVG